MNSEKVLKLLRKFSIALLIGGGLTFLTAILAQEFGFAAGSGEWLLLLGMGMWFLGMLLPGGSGEGGDGGGGE
ncbi:hypothetical protein [Nocardiopsis sp. L17-MgMaSL7]|uniref:hypothetical protein n=1 Tax=Nocardiopsis sp. L17-MgMaSL7 TaxID=1938893 RepID=UPI000D713C26|nr:hypothetical protein [Nocardiopsis sp. L17-MgMaSL7]PWV44586.1 hypothetical protein BDW27_12345 [Nocardiopsis sp. L17-MgMaSL7]